MSDGARNSHIQVRVSGSEKKAIREKAEQANLSMSEFLRSAALDQEIRPVPEINRETWSELSRGLANLNQLARHANEGNVVEIDPADLGEMREQIQELREDLIDP